MTKLKASDIIEIDEGFVTKLAMRLMPMLKNSSPQEDPSPVLYTTEEVARIVNLRPETVRSHIRNYNQNFHDKPTLKAVRRGKSYMITKEELLKYVQHNLKQNQ